MYLYNLSIPLGMLSFIHKLGLISLFAAAMALIETAVVIYLRTLYFPTGFGFPLLPVPPFIALVEIGREIATLIMLFCIGGLAGKRFYEQLGWTLYTWALWDLFYYLFLKILIQWPESLLSWDLLFLIPWPWAGPVLAPMINALFMLLLGLMLIRLSTKKPQVKTGIFFWLLLGSGSVMALWAYLQAYFYAVFSHSHWPHLQQADYLHQLMDQIIHVYPAHFHWPLFIAGVCCHLAAILLLGLANRQ